MSTSARLVVSDRWRDTSVAESLAPLSVLREDIGRYGGGTNTALLKPHFRPLGNVLDFLVNEKVAVVLFLPCDVLQSNSKPDGGGVDGDCGGGGIGDHGQGVSDVCERRLQRFHQTQYKHKVAIVLATSGVTPRHLIDLQLFPSHRLSIHVLTIMTPDHLSATLRQLAANTGFNQLLTTESGSSGASGASGAADLQLLRCMSEVRGVGAAREQKLLRNLHSVAAVAAASQQQLQELVGTASAEAVMEFFHGSCCP